MLSSREGAVQTIKLATTVRQRLKEHCGDVRPAVSIEIGASRLTKGTDVGGVGRKGNIRFGLRVVVVPLKLEVAAAPGALFGKRLWSDGGFMSPAPEGWREEDDEDADAAGLELGLELELGRELGGVYSGFCFLVGAVIGRVAPF